jgi:two-component system chemotaxis response regulator CheB
VRPSLVVVIGCSTGGPRALATLMPDLPLLRSVAWVIVQHMPGGFTRSLAERLDNLTALDVHEAGDGEPLTPGAVLVAPGDRHLRIDRDGCVRFDDSPRPHGPRPAVDVTLRSAASAFGRMTVAAVLTGIGQDGTDGARAVHEAGGLVVAEDESTCVVYGMPHSVIRSGVADRVAPISGMADAIGGLAGGRLSAQSTPDGVADSSRTSAGATIG